MIRIISNLIFVFSFFAVSISSVNASEDSVNENNKQPNILWIYMEDVSGWFSCYGETLIKTPNMDELAESGIRYDRYYAPAGVCSASRSAVVTGMMQTSIGAHNHRSCRSNFRGKVFDEYDKNDLPETVIPLPILFKQAGYCTFNEGGKDDYNFLLSLKKKQKNKTEKYIHFNLTTDKSTELIELLNQIMDEQKSYLDSGFNITQLAELIGISSVKLSQ